jgi:signal transduction histidine kinase
MATVSTVGSPRTGGWRRWGIRQQLTFAATVAVTIPFLLGIFVLATLLHAQLTASLRSTVVDESHRLASTIATSGPDVIAEPDMVDDGFQAQVADTSGQVVASWNHNITAPIATLTPAVGEVVVSGETPIWVPGEVDATDLVVGSGVSYGGKSYVLLVGASQQHEHEAVTTMVKLLLFALPLLMLLSALAAYWLVRRALAPVEEITDRVKGITARSLTERVPVPATADEIGTLATTMNGMLARLEASQGAQLRFVSDASHELRSPLTTLAGALEIGSSAHNDRTWNELAPLMQAETTRLEGLVADLLLLSRSDDRGLRLNLSEVDLDDLVDAETRRLRDSGAIQVRREVRATRIVGDREKLLKVLRNLDDNAVRHAKGVVLLAVGPRPDGGARIEVSDDGSGVPQADRARIFERFVRLDESRSRDSGGSGLGLAIVAEVVHAHGGTVSVEDSGLGGASFVIELPARPPATPPRSLP